MMKNLFWPIYKQIEKEFKELSFFITIDRRQLKTYSIKIADLILRTVSEIENISKELCKREGIKFKDKNGKLKKVIYLNEYIDYLNKIFNLKDKLVSFNFENVDKNTFDVKHDPFRKIKRVINGKEIEVWTWYKAYNQIKHDRVKNFKEANIQNLIDGLAGLFLLNVYYKNEVFYIKDDYNVEQIINQISSFSDVFSVDSIIKLGNIDELDNYRYDGFFSPKIHWEVSNPMSSYFIEYDKVYKTDADRGADIAEKLKSGILVQLEDGSFTKLHEDYIPKDNQSLCKIVAYLNRVS